MDGGDDRHAVVKEEDMSKRPSYREAIWWLSRNDDNTYVREAEEGDNVTLSEAASLVADVFGKEDADVFHALKLAVLKYDGEL